MKKVFFLTLILAAAFSVSSFAQGRQQMSPEQMRQMTKDRLKEALKWDDAVADSVAAVTVSFSPKQREIFMNQEMTQEQKQEKIKGLQEEMKKSIKKFLSDDQMKKYEEWQEQMRAQRANRGGGGK